MWLAYKIDLKRVYSYVLLLVTLQTSYGQSCQMEGVTFWPVPVSEQIWDWYRGEVTNRATTNIEGINSISYGQGLNRGPYVDVSFSNSRFIMSTNGEYPLYEEYETSETMSLTINFSCTGGTSTNLVFIITVTDSNNNPPRFRPADELEFTVMPPLPPGYLVTGCLNNIIVRDIDLTTMRIDFGIEENPYFEIVRDASASTTDKEFAGILRSKTFIRSLPEPVILTISATDVDRTNDPPITNTTEIRITSDLEFQMPEEPVFSQTFYLATYTEDNQLILQDPISLQQGYDELVTFNLEGAHSSYFNLHKNGNLLSLAVRVPLPSEILIERQIFLIVNAEREYTSGRSATIIIELPEDKSLEFKRAHYTGSITDNNLSLTPLLLSQGYEGTDVSVLIFGEHSSYFNAAVHGNVITVTMEPLSENIISENNFIYLEIVASNGRSSTRAVATLEIVKDDNVTPMFNQAIYNGNYDPATGLAVDQILIVQGFDDTVLVNIQGDDASYFEIIQDGPAIYLSVLTLPIEIYNQSPIVLSIKASKPRTVGANAAIVITLPAARQLEFESSTYRGTLQDNTLTLETIALTYGYEEGVNFKLTGEYSIHFNVDNALNQTTISLLSPLPNYIIEDNNLIVLTLTASGINAIPTTTSIILDIIKDDTNTPVFNRTIYYGSYTGSSIDIENINLAQGYDESVTFRIEGEHSQYFTMSSSDNNVILSVQSAIPEEVIFNEKVLSFSLLAEKNLTVGANSAIIISFPTELTDTVVMRFAQNTYVGALADNALSLEDIVLNVGYAIGTEFRLSGEYSEYFVLTYTNNVVSINVTTLPLEVIENNKVIVLEVEAQRERAVSVSATIVIDVVKEDVVPLVFSQAYYRGMYTEETGLLFNEQISLINGYDGSVQFELQGDYASFFELVRNENSLTLDNVRPLTQDVLGSHNQLLLTVTATRPNAFTGQTVLSIDLPKESPEAVVLSFTENSYIGSYDQGELKLPPIGLDSNFDAYIAVTGEYAVYFNVSNADNVITIKLTNELPVEVISQNTIILLNLEAYYPNSISGYATVVIEIIKESAADMPVFDRAYYSGEYSSDGLSIEHMIQLIQGFDDSVVFTLAGDDSQWFTLEHRGPNNLSILLIDDRIQEITNRGHLTFSIEAHKPGSMSGNAAVIISLTDTTTVRILQFTQDIYMGIIENNTFVLEDMYLEGYASDVTYNLVGDYSNYFQMSNEMGTFTLTLRENFPESNENYIILTLEAIIENRSRTHATIIIEIIRDDDGESSIDFEENYYIGSYSAADGLNFNTDIRLAQGYGPDISFSLIGDKAQWFELVESGNSITIILTSPIPPAVVATNQQLVFVVSAQGTGSIIARATIIITLGDEFTGDIILGFERLNYQGTIENNQILLEPITLIQGFSADVAFALRGELESYFSLSSVDANVTIGLRSAIPEQSIPENGVIVLDLQATAPQALTAYATVMFTGVTDRGVVDPVIALAFTNPYYTGSYNASESLIFEDPISLSRGYDDSVVFALEGDQSQWFELVQSGNSATLRLASSVPPAVVATNQQLVFVVSARGTGSITARATIIITLGDEFTGDIILGFERLNYQGTIENNQILLEPITLIQGFSADVAFALRGELESYFSLSSVDANVTIGLRSAIPEQSIPENGVIVLDLQATAPQALTAYATVMFTGVTDRGVVDPVIELAFTNPYYTGSYTASESLIFEDPISLSRGYDDSVVFALEGDQSQWFELVQSGNSATLRLASSVPPAVVATNQQLVFVVSARGTGSITARATIIITLGDEFTGDTILGFERLNYQGTIENNQILLEPITLIQGFSADVAFALRGELESYFSLSSVDANVTIGLRSAIPEQSIPENGVIVLDLQATAPQALTAYATVMFTGVTDRGVVDPVIALAFTNPYYTGSYTASESLIFEDPITLSRVYDDSVVFALEGDQSQWFELVQSGNSATLRLASSVPPAVVATNQQLVFVVSARGTGSTTARATIIITLGDEFTGDTILGFERLNYQGTIENNQILLEPITLIQGFSADVAFALRGELESYFSLSSVDANVTIGLRSAIPEQSIPENGVIVLDLQATAPQALTAYATVMFTGVTDREVVDPVIELAFTNPYYTGSYTASESLIFEDPISLSRGYDDSVVFALEGDQSQWFELVQSGNSATLRLASSVPPAVVATNQQLVFVVSARGTGSITARATIIITLGDEFTGDTILGFERLNYQGTIENNQILLEPITLIQGFSADVAFALRGELESYFSLSSVDANVTIGLRSAIPEQSIPENGVIVLDLQATAPQALTAYATVMFTGVTDRGVVDPVIALAFTNPYYTGSYTASESLIFEDPISLSRGYDDSVVFALEGDQSQWFELVQSGNSATLRLASSVPPAVVATNQQLVFVVSARGTGSITARATIIISLLDDTQIGVDVYFENVLYSGIVQNDSVQHESIRITGFTGTNINIIGEYASLFVAFTSEEVVTVQRSGLTALPDDVEHLALELHAGAARSVLILRILQSGVVNQPTVTFTAASYSLRSDVTQTGLLGRVVATADNGEAVAYSLVLDNAHLQSRLSIKSEGELYLSAPANSGIYTFEVAATTVFTQATGVATVHLTVDSITVCGDDELVVPPLIILDRDEEEPHRNLVVINTTHHEGCWYSLTNRWPIDQTWLYVDETGLHAAIIDREHESIAFMALSQIQVELVLHCDTDNTIRTKRSLEEMRLGPYDYGDNNWILTDTIQYNSRRSFVNLIVNDINDNAPIFNEKDQEPVPVGYPIPELIDTVLPRALAELQATDADIGENAELLYWSAESVLAVAPSTGFVHVRDGAQIEDRSQFTIYATDRNGEGLRGSINIVVRLLDTSNIVVMIVRDAFLDDEKNIIQELSANVGYEIKVLRSVVISADVENDPDNLRMKRDTRLGGASLQLYVYGLIAREPVTAQRLAIDINNIAIGIVSITSTISLEDYLEGREICVMSGRDTGLFVATIVLSVLLFIILVSTAVWYFLKWRKERYDQFSDENSLTSRKESFDQLPKPEAISTPKMRLNIEDLKKSERRLQDMLDVPIEEISVETSTSKNNKPFESILDLPPLDSNLPIVIQSIDKLKDPEEDSDEDEFGEKNKSRRKSVVTFNENVEKIIHVEDDEDTASQSNYEVYKL